MPSFEGLPPELQLQSLSNPSAREIQRCRRVSRYLRDLIELKSNQTLHIEPGVAASRARVQALTQRYCEYPFVNLDKDGNDLGMLNAFRDFSMLYGIGNAASDSKYLAHLNYFARHLACRHADTLEDASPIWEYFEHYCKHLENLFASLLTVHLFLHYGSNFAIYDRVHLEWLPTVADMIYRPEWTGMPLDSRTAILGPLSDSHDCNARIERLLSVPHIPHTASYQYYFQTEWARERVRSAVEGETLPLLVTAALLADLMLG